MIEPILTVIDNSRLTRRKFIIFLLVNVLSACQIIPDVFRSEKATLENLRPNDYELKPGDNVIGQIVAVRSQKNETLPDFARHYSLGYDEISQANENLNIWQLDEASRVILPLHFVLPNAPQKGIILNLANMRLFYFPNNNDQVQSKTVLSFPIGIGKEGWSTPLGKTKIISKIKAPNWHVPLSIRREHAKKGDPLPAVVKSGPNNPLGDFAMRLGLPSYLIHGTNKPYGVGLRISHGCVRLYPKDIENLFHQVSVKTHVNIVDQPLLAGWQEDMLYLEIHQSSKQTSDFSEQVKTLLKDKLKHKPGAIGKKIDWEQVKKILAEPSGTPQPVLTTDESLSFSFSSPKAPLVKRPEKLYGMPTIPALLKTTWSLFVTQFQNEEHAEKLAAILNHQGPQIPSRVFENEQNFNVVAGPFETKKQAQNVAQRIKIEFEIDSKILKPD